MSHVRAGHPSASATHAPLWLVIAAFAAIYIIWGSTYLAIRIGVETLPPFLMAGVRSLIAGGLMYAFVFRAQARPTWAQWRAAAIVGGFLLLGGNGLVTWAEKTVPSGVAALLVTTVPIWMVLLHWMWPGGARPTLAEGLGVLLGFSGVVLLLGGGSASDGAAVDRLGGTALVVASLCWSFGSLYARRAALPKAPLLAAAMEMLCGGAMLTVVGLVRGETAEIGGHISLPSVAALVYLIVFGSLIGFTAYSWLLGVTTPAKVATYAFVNPVVAVMLGWTIGKEPFTPRFLMASGVIIFAVVIVVGTKALRSALTSASSSAPLPHGATDASATHLAEAQDRQMSLLAGDQMVELVGSTATVPAPAIIAPARVLTCLHAAERRPNA